MAIKKSISHSHLYLIILLFISSGLLAQQDSLNIHQKILESEESEQMLIQRTRNFILTKLKAANVNEAHEAYNFVIQKYEIESIKPFWITEKFLLGFWFGRYEILYCADSIENAIDFERKEHWNSSRGYLYPQRDKLALELRMISNKHRSELNQRIDSLVNDKEKHDFLILFLDWLTFNATEPEMTDKKEQEYLEKDLTPRAEEFLNLYKNSQFRPFVNRHFRYKYVLNDWGYGYYLGLGSLSPQGIAGQYLNSEFLLGMGFELSWCSTLLDLGFDIGIPVSIRKPFIHEGKTWNTDVRNNYYTFYISSGWIVEETNKFKLIPHIGIGGINMSVSEADKDKVGGNLSMTQAAIQYGVTCDIKLGIDNIFFKENIHRYSGISVGLDYYQFLGNNPIMSNGMLRFRISWIGFGRSILRDL
jgi:hypothetical protein